MDNIYGYIKWMGSFTFEERGFNDLDALVLCQLSYYELKTQRNQLSTLTLRDIFRVIRDETGDNPFFTGFKNEWSDLLCEAAARSARFGNLLVKNYTESLDHKNAIQFAAVTFEMPRHFNFIAYRGTDDTLAGWKEDFMISFTRTTAQEMALRYAQENLLSNTDNMIGGHSKGANLALYASAYLSFDQRDTVSKVYLLDGPGFCPEVLDTSDIAKVSRRAIRITPEFCIIGKLFEPDIENSVIVKSSDSGLLQHDITTWGVEYGKLLTTDEYDETAQKLNSLIDRWIENLDQDEREVFVNELFDALASDGSLTVSDIMSKGVDSFENIVMTLLSGSHTTRRAVASLPEQVFFGNTFTNIKKVGFFQWLKDCKALKNIALFVIGLFFVLASDKALEITAMALFIALTVVELVLTIHRLIKAKWDFRKIKERIYLLVALVAICIVIVVKDQALFMIGSILYGVSSLIIAFLQLSKATVKNDDPFMRVVRSVETALLFIFGFSFLIISYDKIYGYSLTVGILLMVDGALRIGYTIYRYYHPAIPKPARRRNRLSRGRSDRRNQK